MFNKLKLNNKDLRNLIIIESSYLVFASFMGFVNFKVWEKTEESFNFFLIYYLFYFTVRMIALIVSNYLVIKYKTTSVLKVSLYILLFSPIIYLFVLNKVENIYLWLLLINIPNASTVSFFGTTYNLLLSYYGKKHNMKEYTGFFSLKVFISSAIGFLIPLTFGLFIDSFGFNYIMILIIISGITGLLLFPKLEKVKVETECKDGKEMMKLLFIGTKSNKRVNRIIIMHSIYIVITAFMFQYLDILQTLIKFTISEDNTQLGLLSVAIFATNAICLFIFNKIKLKKEIWFFISSTISLISLIMAYKLTEQNLILVLIVLSVGLYFFKVLIGSVTFELMDGFTSKERYSMLMKRETISILSKVAFILVALMINLQDFKETPFLVLTILYVILLIISNWLYIKLNKKTGI